MGDGMASGGRDAGAVTSAPFVLGEEPGAIVAGFDVHRRQITVEALDTATGEVSRGRIESTPAAVEEWAAGFQGRSRCPRNAGKSIPSTPRLYRHLTTGK